MQLSRNALHWRDLLVELVARDLKVRYQRSAIGLGWSLMKPLSQLTIFAIVFSSVLPLGIEHYTTFVFAGVLTWAWFSTALTAATTSVTGSRELVRRPGFPVSLLPVLAILSNGVHFMLALPLLVICAIVETGWPGASMAALPAMIALQFVLIMAFAQLMAAIQVYFRDFEHLITIVMMLGFYITPVFYRPIGIQHDYGFLTTFNPMAWILEGYRAILWKHEWPDSAIFLKVLALALPVMVLGNRFFVRVSARFVDEL